jgi:adenylosuccinate lyase
MSQLFSQRSRHSTWRKLWLSLAESEKELGIPTITEEALEQMRAHLTVTDEDFEVARVEEKIRRHVRYKNLTSASPYQARHIC